MNYNNFPESYRDKLIAVTNRHLLKDGISLNQQIEEIGHFSPHAIILREKDLSEDDYMLIAKDFTKICERFSVTCILHTFADVAIELNCRNIHLPLSVYQAIADNGYKTAGGHDIRKHFEKIGTSVHSVEDIKTAEKLGASYATAGHIYRTDCKKGLAPRGLEFLSDVCNTANIPVYAIGGIGFNTAQIDEVMAHGAAGACIMSAFMEVQF